jgi:hypothetical protein
MLRIKTRENPRQMFIVAVLRFQPSQRGRGKEESRKNYEH